MLIVIIFNIYILKALVGFGKNPALINYIIPGLFPPFGFNASQLGNIFISVYICLLLFYLYVLKPWLVLA